MEVGRKKKIRFGKIFNFESVVVATLRLIPFSYVASRSIASASCSKTNEREKERNEGEWRGSGRERQTKPRVFFEILRNGAVCIDIFSVLFSTSDIRVRIVAKCGRSLLVVVVRRYATISCSVLIASFHIFATKNSF